MRLLPGSLVVIPQLTTLVYSLLLEDNVGKDGLSSQLTYKDNIEDSYAPGTTITRLLHHCQPSTPVLNDIYCAIMKVLNELRVQITLKKTIHVMDCQGKNISTNIAEVLARDVVFSSFDNNELVDWTSINKFASFGYCEDIHLSPILKQEIVKAINESPDHLLPSKLFEDDSYY